MNYFKTLLGTDNEISEEASIFTNKHYINLITSTIIWFSGTIFIYEYFDSPVSKIFFYSIIFSIALILIDWTGKYYKSFLTKDILFLAMLIVTAAAILFYRFDYIGYQTIVGFTILWLVIIYQSKNIKICLAQSIVFFLSPVLYSEANSFSVFFALSMLVVLSIFISERFLENKFNWKFFLIGFLFGVTISAQLFVGIVYIVYLLYFFRNDLRKGLMFILTVLIFNTLSLLLEDKGTLTITALQSNYFQFMPIWIIIILIAAAIYVGWIVSDLQEVLFTSGIILFSIFVLSIIFKAGEFGQSKDEIDFSLLIMTIPFLVLSIKEYKVGQFLGKVLA